MTRIRRQKTERGFIRYDFLDANGDACSLQESSAANEPKIWLGQNQGTHHLGDCLARMHLTRKQAKWIAAKLQRFAETGELP